MSDKPKDGPDTARATPAAKRAELEERNVHGTLRSHGLRITGVEGRMGAVEAELEIAPPAKLAVPRPTPRSPGLLVEKNVAAHRDASVEKIRQQSDHDFEHQALVAAHIAHNERIEGVQRDIVIAVGILAREAGHAKLMPPSIQASLPPPPPEERRSPPKTMREQLREQARLIALVVTLVELLDHLARVLLRH